MRAIAIWCSRIWKEEAGRVWRGIWLVAALAMPRRLSDCYQADEQRWNGAFASTCQIFSSMFAATMAPPRIRIQAVIEGEG